jgi:hypothetical protein
MAEMPKKAIEDVFSWEVFSESVKEAEKLAREEEFDPLELLTNHYSVLRRYSPILLETFEFNAVTSPRRHFTLIAVLDDGRNDDNPTGEDSVSVALGRWRSTNGTEEPILGIRWNLTNERKLAPG